MKFYFAPMEGVTGRIYRRIHRSFFHGTDKYYAPFFSPTASRCFPPREFTELTDTSGGVRLVPQLLTNSADNFIWAAAELGRQGFDEVNLNLGCPSGTVTAKRKGSGLLAFPDELDALLDGICSDPELQGLGLKISVKTRIGFSSPDEFVRILDIYNRYPLHELIVHPRVRADFYKNSVNLDAFEYALRESKNPVVYNGDIFTAADMERLSRRFPSADTVMLGRGLAANPALADRLISGEPLRLETLRAFHDALCSGYREILYGDTALLHRLKELWSYMITMFSDNEKHFKRLKKAGCYSDYLSAANAVFNELELLDDSVGVK